MVLSIDGKEFDGVGTILNFSYDQKKVRELCSHMFLYHEYPFMHVEHVLFNNFMRACTSYWKKITRTSAKNDCFATYENEKQKLKTLLRGVHNVILVYYNLFVEFLLKGFIYGCHRTFH